MYLTFNSYAEVKSSILDNTHLLTLLTKLITFANRKRRPSQTLNYLNIVARMQSFTNEEHRKTFFCVK